jgi:hypothetical protein
MKDWLDGRIRNIYELFKGLQAFKSRVGASYTAFVTDVNAPSADTSASIAGVLRLKRQVVSEYCVDANRTPPNAKAA